VVAAAEAVVAAAAEVAEPGGADLAARRRTADAIISLSR
jgi:hypothetical protein